MKRLAISYVAIVVVLLAGSSGRGVGAQDGAEATISALRTEVAGLRATVKARGEKINRQRTRIAELRDAGAAATPTSPAFELEGVNDVKVYERFVAGVYTVVADCESDAMQVYVLDAAHGIVAQPVNRSALGEDGDLTVDIPADSEYKVEIYCAGRWQVMITQSPESS